MDYKKTHKKTADDENGGGGEDEGSPSQRPRASTRGSVRGSVLRGNSISPVGNLPPHMASNEGFVPHAPRLSAGSFSGHPGMIYPPNQLPGMGIRSSVQRPMTMMMPAGAIHPPMGSPSAIGARRASVSKGFQMSNPPPPMGGGAGRGSVRMPHPREVQGHGDL